MVSSSVSGLLASSATTTRPAVRLLRRGASGLAAKHQAAGKDLEAYFLALSRATKVNVAGRVALASGERGCSIFLRGKI